MHILTRLLSLCAPAPAHLSNSVTVQQKSNGVKAEAGIGVCQVRLQEDTRTFLLLFW